MVDPAPRTDGELIRALKRGDLVAFDALYARYEAWVASLAYRFCGNREDALDVLQETFAYFVRKLPGFELRSRFKTFLYPVVKHVALSRKDASRKFLPLRGENAKGGSPPGRVEDLLEVLPEPQQEVVWLRFVEGLELREIAEALEIPVGTVKSRLHTALGTLREGLA